MPTIKRAPPRPDPHARLRPSSPRSARSRSLRSLIAVDASEPNPSSARPIRRCAASRSRRRTATAPIAGTEMTITLWLALTWPATVRPAEGRGRSVRHSAISHRSESSLRRPASIRSGRSAGGTTSASDTTGSLHVNSGYVRDSSACRSSARPGAISAGSPGVATTPSVSSGPDTRDCTRALGSLPLTAGPHRGQRTQRSDGDARVH